jgi:hypothetical protein
MSTARRWAATLHDATCLLGRTGRRGETSPRYAPAVRYAQQTDGTTAGASPKGWPRPGRASGGVHLLRLPAAKPGGASEGLLQHVIVGDERPSHNRGQHQGGRTTPNAGPRAGGSRRRRAVSAFSFARTARAGNSGASSSPAPVRYSCRLAGRGAGQSPGGQSHGERQRRTRQAAEGWINGRLPLPRGLSFDRAKAD